MKPRCNWVAVVTVLMWFLVSGTASAHGDIEATDPAADSTTNRVPRQITIDFTEAPSNGADIRVVDGCKREVAEQVRLQPDGSAKIAVDKDAEPGSFKVSYRIVSAEDGHPSKGSYAFTVSGKRDCSPDKKKGKDETPDVTADEPSGSDGDSSEDGGSGATWLFIVGGAAVVVAGVALVLRRSGGTS